MPKSRGVAFIGVLPRSGGRTDQAGKTASVKPERAVRGMGSAGGLFRGGGRKDADGKRSGLSDAVDFSRILPLRQGGPEPIYYQIARGMEVALSAGTVNHGMRLPPEDEMACQLKVSRGTIRRAWLYLEQRGMIIRGKKRGTFLL